MTALSNQSKEYKTIVENVYFLVKKAFSNEADIGKVQEELRELAVITSFLASLFREEPKMNADNPFLGVVRNVITYPFAAFSEIAVTDDVQKD